MSRVLNAFTVDVEDYFHVGAFSDRIPVSTWHTFESRVVKNTHRVLRLLGRHATQGTFFVLGWVADRFPELVRDIVRDGHDLGCHSYWHHNVFDQSETEFRDDLIRARDAIADVAGIAVTAYRAPSFSITARSLWAFDVLIDSGFTHDSSIFPVRHDRYGIPDADRFVHRIDRSSGTLHEFPPSTCRIAGVNLPVAGGGYFRLLPVAATCHAVRHINEHEGQPFLFYIHPWELDPDQPRLPGRLCSRLRHYQNLGTTERKLNELLARSSFGTLRSAIAGEEVRASSSDCAMTAPEFTALRPVRTSY